MRSTIPISTRTMFARFPPCRDSGALRTQGYALLLEFRAGNARFSETPHFDPAGFGGGASIRMPGIFDAFGGHPTVLNILFRTSVPGCGKCYIVDSLLRPSKGPQIIRIFVDRAGYNPRKSAAIWRNLRTKMLNLLSGRQSAEITMPQSTPPLLWAGAAPNGRGQTSAAIFARKPSLQRLFFRFSPPCAAFIRVSLPRHTGNGPKCASFSPFSRWRGQTSPKAIVQRWPAVFRRHCRGCL
jgi:hypothetical protein